MSEYTYLEATNIFKNAEKLRESARGINSNSSLLESNRKLLLGAAGSAIIADPRFKEVLETLREHAQGNEEELKALNEYEEKKVPIANNGFYNIGSEDAKNIRNIAYESPASSVSEILDIYDGKAEQTANERLDHLVKGYHGDPDDDGGVVYQSTMIVASTMMKNGEFKPSDKLTPETQEAIALWQAIHDEKTPSILKHL